MPRNNRYSANYFDWSESIESHCSTQSTHNWSNKDPEKCSFVWDQTIISRAGETLGIWFRVLDWKSRNIRRGDASNIGLFKEIC